MAIYWLFIENLINGQLGMAEVQDKNINSSFEIILNYLH